MRLLVLVLLTVTFPASAQTVVDGDTIKFNGTTYRLWGIDAPESHQSCADGWAAGRMATDYLVGLMHDRRITCEAKGKDRYGRTIGLCKGEEQDIGAAMVSAGMAWAFVRYSHDYVAQELEAKGHNFGIHAHGCEPAWEYRARVRGDH